MNMKKTFVVVSLLLGMAALAAAQGGQVLLNAAGATFPYPIYSKWFDVYHTAHPNVEINYQSIGSGGGIRQLQSGTVDFGASDGPMSDDQLSQSKFKILHFPTVLGAVVPTYNIVGVTGDLNFTQKALAGIYLGSITKWNDPKSPKPIPASIFPVRTSSSCTVPMAAALPTFLPIFSRRSATTGRTTWAKPIPQ